MGDGLSAIGYQLSALSGHGMPCPYRPPTSDLRLVSPSCGSEKGLPRGQHFLCHRRWASAGKSSMGRLLVLATLLVAMAPPAMDPVDCTQTPASGQYVPA